MIIRENEEFTDEKDREARVLDKYNRMTKFERMSAMDFVYLNSINSFFENPSRDEQLRLLYIINEVVSDVSVDELSEVAIADRICHAVAYDEMSLENMERLLPLDIISCIANNNFQDKNDFLEVHDDGGNLIYDDGEEPDM